MGHRTVGESAGVATTSSSVLFHHLPKPYLVPSIFDPVQLPLQSRLFLAHSRFLLAGRRLLLSFEIIQPQRDVLKVAVTHEVLRKDFLQRLLQLGRFGVVGGSYPFDRRQSPLLPIQLPRPFLQLGHHRRLLLRQRLQFLAQRLVLTLGALRRLLHVVLDGARVEHRLGAVPGAAELAAFREETLKLDPQLLDLHGELPNLFDLGRVRGHGHHGGGGEGLGHARIGIRRRSTGLVEETRDLKELTDRVTVGEVQFLARSKDEMGLDEMRGDRRKGGGAGIIGIGVIGSARSLTLRLSLMRALANMVRPTVWRKRMRFAEVSMSPARERPWS